MAVFTAAITTINEEQESGSTDRITIWDADSEVETVEVGSSENAEPYERALTDAGWVITGLTAARQHIHGGDGWTLARR